MLLGAGCNSGVTRAAFASWSFRALSLAPQKASRRRVVYLHCLRMESAQILASRKALSVLASRKTSLRYSNFTVDTSSLLCTPNCCPFS
jgi:hypothetical protein